MIPEHRSQIARRRFWCCLGWLVAAKALGCAPASTAPIPASAPIASAPPKPPSPSTPAAAGRPRFLLKHDAQVMVNEPAPHQGIGNTTAYRYFDELKDAGVIFRKRALHPGAANGLNVLKHEEVFYVLSGRGELDVDGTLLELEPGAAVYLNLGAAIRLRQVGSDDLVVIIAYPPATSH